MSNQSSSRPTHLSLPLISSSSFHRCEGPAPSLLLHWRGGCALVTLLLHWPSAIDTEAGTLAALLHQHGGHATLLFSSTGAEAASAVPFSSTMSPTAPSSDLLLALLLCLVRRRSTALARLLLHQWQPSPDLPLALMLYPLHRRSTTWLVFSSIGSGHH